jgi:hypothetical protein
MASFFPIAEEEKPVFSLRLNDRSSFPGWEGIFFPRHHLEIVSRTHTVSYPVFTRSSFPMDKAAGG